MKKNNKEELKKTKQEVKSTYGTILELKEYFGNMSLPMKTPNDLKLLLEKQNIFDSIAQNLYEKINSISFPENINEDEKKEFKQSFVDEFLNTPSGVTKDEIVIFENMEQFFESIKGLTLSNKQIVFLMYWFTKEEV